jgi:hypothetical protein
VFSVGILKKLGLTFFRAFVAAFVVGIAGIYAVPDLNAAKALVLAAITAGIAAGVHAIDDAISVQHAKSKVKP